MLKQELINLKSLDETTESSVSVSELLIAYGDCVPIGENKCYWSLSQSGYDQMQTSFTHMQMKLDWLHTLYLISSAEGEVISIGVRYLF